LTLAQRREEHLQFGRQMELNKDLEEEPRTASIYMAIHFDRKDFFPHSKFNYQIRIAAFLHCKKYLSSPPHAFVIFK
jgi:hypothetical protein